ncbi:hypothetical protein C0993_000968 [Termitomyces sp. T159_Od127]|nr:hypothetical protein C0993_000968 [Termitomyces sp. T159_Od127]
MLVLASGSAQQLAPHPRPALSNKLQRRQIVSGVVDFALGALCSILFFQRAHPDADNINTLGNVIELHRPSPTSPSVPHRSADTITPSSSERPTSTSPITSAPAASSDSSTSSDLSITKPLSSSKTASSSPEATVTHTGSHDSSLSSSSITGQVPGHHHTGSSLGATSILPPVSLDPVSTSASTASANSTVHSESSSTNFLTPRPTSTAESHPVQTTINSTISNNSSSVVHHHSSTSKADATSTGLDLLPTSPTGTQGSPHAHETSSIPATSHTTGQVTSHTHKDPHPHHPKPTSNSVTTTSASNTTSEVPTSTVTSDGDQFPHTSKPTSESVSAPTETSSGASQTSKPSSGMSSITSSLSTTSQVQPTTQTTILSTTFGTHTHTHNHTSKSTSTSATTTSGSSSPIGQAPTSVSVSGTSETSTSPIQTSNDTNPHSSTKTSSDSGSTTSGPLSTSQASTTPPNIISTIVSIVSSALVPHTTHVKTNSTSVPFTSGTSTVTSHGSSNTQSSTPSQTTSIPVSATSETSNSTSQASSGGQNTQSQTRPGSHTSRPTEGPSSSISVVPPSSQSSAAPSSRPVSGGSSSVSTSSIPTVPSSISVSGSQSVLPSSSGGSSNSSNTIILPTSTSSSSGGNLGAGDGTMTSRHHAPTVTSDLSFVLSVSSLAVAPAPTTTSSITITNPDAPMTTLSLVSEPGTAPMTTLPQPLPSGLPSRIVPPTPLDLSQVTNQYTMISILFDEELNWPFVVGNQLSSSQIFAWITVIIQTALNLTADQVKTYVLQVYIPATYTGPNDKSQLGTTWLGFIPGDQVDALAAMIKNKSSKFYTGVNNPVAQALANHVNSGFSLNAIPAPEATGSIGGPDPDLGATSDGGKTRQDAIIGVVSALGGIAILVLAFLLYRSWKRRRELAHRRISDPPPEEYIGARPEGRDFDQDSVGGQRRRSFYFAEDSLRGFQQQSTAAESNISASPQQSMVQRRNLTTNMISTPVLQESSLHF